MKKISFWVISLLLLLSMANTTKATITSLVVNVTTYGANGNDSFEDTIAFQKAIDYVSSKGGGDVYVPSGKYIVKPIKLKSNVNLIGENRDTVTLKLSDTADDQKASRLLNIDSIKNVQVRNITFDGNYAMHTDGIEHMHTVFIWNSDNVVIDNNRMQNAVADGISVTGDGITSTGVVTLSNYVTVSNNILINNHRANIVVEQVNHLEIMNNTSTSTIGESVLHFEPWEEMNLYDVKIHHNYFKSNSTGYAITIEGVEEGENYFNDVEFYNNTVDTPNAEFLIMETKNAKFHDNLFNVKSMFVWIKNVDLKIYHNTINASSTGFKISGTWGINSIRTTLSDNTVTLNGGDAIKLQYGAQDTSFIRNTFVNKIKGQYAAYIKATETDITNTRFIGNTFNNFQYGIYTSTYNYNIENGLYIQDNIFKNISYYSVYVRLGTAKNVTVGANTYISAGGVYVKQ